MRTAKYAGALSLGLVTAMFLATNVAYVAAIPKEDIRNAGQLVGALFFQRVFGESWAAKILPVMVVFSCLGNIVSCFVTSFDALEAYCLCYSIDCCREPPILSLSSLFL